MGRATYKGNESKWNTFKHNQAEILTRLVEICGQPRYQLGHIEAPPIGVLKVVEVAAVVVVVAAVVVGEAVLVVEAGVVVTVVSLRENHLNAFIGRELPGSISSQNGSHKSIPEIR